MIPMHDPYNSILSLMYPGVTEKNILQKNLLAKKQWVKNLRKDYNCSTPSTSYTEPGNNDAYMVAYYPYYIETLHRILDRLDTASPNTLQNLFAHKTELTVAFLGTGPSPELLGLLSYVNCHHPKIRHVRAYLFDINTEHWEPFRKQYTMPMTKTYASSANVTYETVTCDFLTCSSCIANQCKPMLAAADILVMQNCVTDLITARDQRGLDSGFSFADLFAQMRSGALFVLSDLNYPGTSIALQEAVTSIEGTGIGDAILSNIEQIEKYEPKFKLPDIFGVLFDGSEWLIPKKFSKFQFAVLQRCISCSDDWIAQEIETYLYPDGYRLSDRIELQYCRRYKIRNEIGETYLDVYYDKKFNITKPRYSADSFASMDKLLESIRGKNLTPSKIETQRTDNLFDSIALATEHDALKAKIQKNNLTLIGIKMFQYMVRYEIQDEHKHTAVFDRYYNARGVFTKVLPQAGMSTSSTLLERILEIVR